MDSAADSAVTEVLASPQSTTHVVLFQHPNSLLPQTWGTAEVAPDNDGDVDVDQIIMEAWLTDPHHSLDTDYFDLEKMREFATIFPVEAPVSTRSARPTGTSRGSSDD
jgi:hypothetical protein